MAKEDLSGQRFGKWIVSGPTVARPRYWDCECECGRKRAVYGGNLKNGASASCGCTIGPSAQARFGTHRLSDTKLHMVWGAMRQRCQNPANKGFKNYGARGISVCERWASFEAFLEDMAPTYVEGLTLERKDNDGPYSPENCVWATYLVQGRNRRDNVYVDTPSGRMIMSEAARVFGVSAKLLWYRTQRGYVGAALLAPPRKREKTCESSFLGGPTQPAA